MRPLPVLVSACLCALAACSSGSDDSPSATGATPGTDPAPGSSGVVTSDDVPDAQGGAPRTEEAAVEAVTSAIEATLQNRPDDVIAFLDAECRATVDRSEVVEGLALAQLFLGGGGLDLSRIEVTGSIVSFDGDTATVDVEIRAPEGDDLGGFDLTDDRVETSYEDGRWVGEGCDFSTSSSDADADLEAALEAAGLSGTQDDPVPAGILSPVAEGFRVQILDLDPDAKSRIEAEGSEQVFLTDGQDSVALLRFRLGHAGPAEPTAIDELDADVLSVDSAGLDRIGCGGLADDIFFSDQEAFAGSAGEYVACFAYSSGDLPDVPLVAFDSFSSDRPVFFSPTVAADRQDELVGTVGPSPEGRLTSARLDPAPLGTAVDIGEGFLLTVNGFDPNSSDAIVANSTFDVAPPPGHRYALVDVTVAYQGDSSSAAYPVEIGVVGDSNFSDPDDCGFADVPDELDRDRELFDGGSISGQVCLLVADDQVDSLVAYATARFFDTDPPEFFALR